MSSTDSGMDCTGLEHATCCTGYNVAISDVLLMICNAPSAVIIPISSGVDRHFQLEGVCNVGTFLKSGTLT
jgi:hypothetical protein